MSANVNDWPLPWHRILLAIFLVGVTLCWLTSRLGLLEQAVAPVESLATQVVDLVGPSMDPIESMVYVKLNCGEDEFFLTGIAFHKEDDTVYVVTPARVLSSVGRAMYRGKSTEILKTARPTIYWASGDTLHSVKAQFVGYHKYNHWLFVAPELRMPEPLQVVGREKSRVGQSIEIRQWEFDHKTGSKQVLRSTADAVINSMKGESKSTLYILDYDGDLNLFGGLAVDDNGKCLGRMVKTQVRSRSDSEGNGRGGGYRWGIGSLSFLQDCFDPEIDEVHIAVDPNNFRKMTFVAILNDPMMQLETCELFLSPMEKLRAKAKAKSAVQQNRQWNQLMGDDAKHIPLRVGRLEQELLKQMPRSHEFGYNPTVLIGSFSGTGGFRPDSFVVVQVAYTTKSGKQARLKKQTIRFSPSGIVENSKRPLWRESY